MVFEIKREGLALVEGGIMLSRAFDGKTLLARQTMAYRTYVKLAFEQRAES